MAEATFSTALDALQSYGLPVTTISIVWNIKNGTPYEKLWRITFARPMGNRADEHPMFIYGYRHSVHR